MAHVPSLPTDPALGCWQRKSDPAVGCWHRKYYEEEEELLPLYVRGLKPKAEGSLRRRLLSAKIHQKQDALWAPKPLGARHAAPCPRPPCSPRLACQYPAAVSSLDEESRWTVHYAAPWREQEDLLLPGTRPTCVDELHRQAKLNLKPNISECDKLSRDWWRSSWYCPQHSTLSTYSLQSHSASQQDYEEVKKLTLLGCLTQSCLTACCHCQPRDQKPTGSSAEEHLEFLSRSQTPPGEESDDPAHTAWSHALPLPTPEERMRQQALAITAHIVPIDITGETFDRQASIRHSMVSMVTSDTTDRWRQTTPGVPRDIQQEAGQARLPGHSSYACSVTSSTGPPPTCDSSCQTEDEEEEEDGRRDEAEERTLPPSARRIRAQRGQGVSALLSNMSASWSGDISASGQRPTEPLYHSLPRLHASAHTEPCNHSAPCCPEDQHAGTLQTGHQSQQASAPPAANPPPPESRPPPRSESSQSDASSSVTADQWEYEYEALPSSPLSSRCSSPADCRSLGSAGGVRSQSYSSIGPKRAVYRCWQHHSERSGLATGRPMCRSISLRKAKRPPAPPARSDSLPSTATPAATPTSTPMATLFTSAQHGHASCKDLWVLRKCSSPSNSGCHSPASATPPESPAHTTPPHSPAHTTPPHSPAHATPPHSPAHATPPHSPAHAAPPHSPAHATPPHSPAHATPPHSPAHVTPPHSPAHITPPHSPAHATPPHSPAHATPPHSPAYTTAQHSPAHTTPSQTPAQATPPHSWSSTESLPGVSMVTASSNSVPASPPPSIGCSAQFHPKPFTLSQGRVKPSVPERKSSLLSSKPPPPSPPPLPPRLPLLPTPPPLHHHTSTCSRHTSLTSLTPNPPPPVCTVGQNAPSTPEKSLPNSVSPPPLTSTPRSVPAPPSPVPLKGLREICDADKGVCSLGPSPPRFTTPILQVLQVKPIRWAPAGLLPQEAAQQRTTYTHKHTLGPAYEHTLTPAYTHEHTLGPAYEHTPTPAYTHEHTLGPAYEHTPTPAYTHEHTLGPAYEHTPTPAYTHEHTLGPAYEHTPTPAYTHEHTLTDSGINPDSSCPLPISDVKTQTVADLPSGRPEAFPAANLIMHNQSGPAAQDQAPPPTSPAAPPHILTERPRGCAPLKPVTEGGAHTLGANTVQWGGMEQQAPGENSRDWGSMEQQAPGENSRDWGSMEVDSESGGSTPLNCSRESLVSEISTRSLEELQFPALSIQERELPPYPCGSGAAGDTDSDSSATGSVSPKDERNADVFEEMLEELLTPMPPRTTEDLFVAIHRMNMSAVRQTWPVLVEEEGSGLEV